MHTLRTRLDRATLAARPTPPVEIRVVFVGEEPDAGPRPGEIHVDLTRRPA